ncbi:protein spinster homolog 1-like [Anneissia japonica]|uniref:protein spinster homolog 1-like n=1 Tax=Anneissia japonica TaxID=1529436 RepID=UPI0014257D2C|nr:protein spinster homolog 1-like [Anneissia japonica]
MGMKASKEYSEDTINIPSLHRAIVSLMVLFFVYVLNQTDRQVLPVLIPAGLRCSFNSSDQCVVLITNNKTPKCDCIDFDDTQQGILTGAAYTVMYTLAGIPLARVADKTSRVIILLAGIFFWSLMVFLTGFAKKFWVLLVARMMLGIGEASCNPAAYSLISDYFLPLHRAKALSFYHFGIYAGGAIGYSLGALSSVICWKWTFFSLSILGFVTVLVAAFVLREAQREAPLLKYGSYTIKETAALLITTKPYVMLTTAAAIRHIGGYALGTWLATFYMRQFSQDSVDYGINIALVVLFGGSLGCLIGGILADRYSTSKRQAKAYVIAVSQCIAAPCIVAPLLVPKVSTSYGLLCLAYLTAETWIGCSAAIVQDLFAPSLRAQASAVYIAVCTIIGGSIGPSLVPLILNVSGWDACNKGMGYALLTIVPTSYLISAFLFFLVGYMMTEELIISDETIHLTYESSEHSYSVYDSSTEVESASLGSKRKRRSKSQEFTSSQHETQLYT